jgi:lipopolysaccharide export system protein LptA
MRRADMAVVIRALLFFLTIGVVGSGFFWPQWGFGKNKDISEPSRPIVTTADTLELDNKNKIATFSGNVVSKQEQQGKEPIIIYCNKMVIYSVEEIGKKPSPSSSKGNEKKSQAQQNQVDKIVASGQVKILQGKDVATGETAVFYNADQRIVLSGNPKVWQGKNLIKGEEITVWIKENRSLVTSKGSNRVQAVIYQEEKQGSQAVPLKGIDQPEK